MKSVLLVLLGLAIYPVLADVTELIDSKYDTNYWIKVGVPSYGITLGLTGRCNQVMRPSKVTNAQYFGCGKLNTKITELLYKDE